MRYFILVLGFALLFGCDEPLERITADQGKMELIIGGTTRISGAVPGAMAEFDGDICYITGYFPSLDFQTTSLTFAVPKVRTKSFRFPGVIGDTPIELYCEFDPMDGGADYYSFSLNTTDAGSLVITEFDTINSKNITGYFNLKLARENNASDIINVQGSFNKLPVNF